MTTKSARAPRVNKQIVASVSGSVFVSLLLGAISGVAWAFIRPRQLVQLLEDDQLAIISQSADAGFLGVMWFVGLTAVCGLALGMLVFRKQRIVTPKQMLISICWIGVAALMSSAVTYVVGQSVAGMLQPELTSLQPGDEVKAIPDFTTISALLVAPLVAMLSLWARVLFQGDGGDGGDTNTESDTTTAPTDTATESITAEAKNPGSASAER